MRCRATAMLIVVLVLSACARPPSKQFVHLVPNLESRMDRLGPISIVADVCLFKDSLGDNDFWVIQASSSGAEHMLQAAKTYLEGKGYKVSYAQAPFVGAFKNIEESFQVCSLDGQNIVEKYPPLFESEGFADNPAYREALLKILPKVPSLQASAPGSQDICCASAEMKQALRAIAESTAGETTLFLIGNGVIVSAGKQLTQGVATGLLTAALTLGTVSIIHHEVSYMDTYAALVDNATGEILWSNAMRLRGDGLTEKGYYKAEKWPRSILYHMPAKTGEQVESAASERPAQPEALPETVALEKPDQRN